MTASNIADMVWLPPHCKTGSEANRLRELLVRAASHQLRVARMATKQFLRHDPLCRLCQVRVPWKRDTIGDAVHLESGLPGEAPLTNSAVDGYNLKENYCNERDQPYAAALSENRFTRKRAR